MRILIAADKFKGSASAREACQAMAAGMANVLPDAEIEIAPVADGGEGTAEIICAAWPGEWLTCDAHDPLGRAIKAHYRWIDAKAMGVMEMSEAAGLRRLVTDERNPMRADTQGVGEMILHAAQQGASKIVVGLGGSATTDGGFGLARALGFRFFGMGRRGQPTRERLLQAGPDSLLDLGGIERPSARGPALPQVIAAADVRNPLLGPRGTAHVFARQKGASPAQVEVLENALQRLADVVKRDLGCDFRECCGAGAAGGLGFGMMTFCGATVQPGFLLVAGLLGLEEKVSRAHVVVTGEGRLDAQTFEGKAPAGVAALARKHGKPVYAIVGELATDAEPGRFDGVWSLVGGRVGRAESMRDVLPLLRGRAAELGLSLSVRRAKRGSSH